VAGDLLVIDILINANARETRVALLENKVLVELFIERQQTQSLVGNIYKGRVSKVLPGMQAAFVDIGLAKAGFLHASDIPPNTPPATAAAPFALLSGVDDANRSLSVPELPVLSIRELLREDQELLVQIAKEPLGTKGCRLTAYLTLAGRAMVLMPGVEHIGVSRRLTLESERGRLQECVKAILPPAMGCILRTLSAGASQQDLQADLRFLLARWQQLQVHARQATPPCLIHQESNVVLRTLRDLFSDQVNQCLIDHPDIYMDAQDFVRAYYPPPLAAKIRLYHDAMPLFDAFDLEKDIDRALARKVWLKSGGYITIDHTEALVAIDVNTGRFVGQNDFEGTIVQTNLEAVHEIARQVRLRNLGGLIVIDFIDMASEAHREGVFQALELALQGDRARTKILGISEFGIVEMTRQRARTALYHTLCEPCATCHGTGMRESIVTVCSKVFRDLHRLFALGPAPHKVQIHVSRAIAEALHDQERPYLEQMEKRYHVSLVVTSDDEIPYGQFEVLAL
jgi:ribonuclease G